MVRVPGQDETQAATQQYSAGVSAANKEVSAAKNGIFCQTNRVRSTRQ
jgi:hypothetical protein